MLRHSGVRFDETYRFSGGSDTVFFMCVHHAGYLMIWADEALATEWIPKSRATLKWLAMRPFRNGGTKAGSNPSGAASAVRPSVWQVSFLAQVAQLFFYPSVGIDR
jgi:hypothetical protein